VQVVGCKTTLRNESEPCQTSSKGLVRELTAISLGEPQAGTDPRMPEWGNLAGVMPSRP